MRPKLPPFPIARCSEPNPKRVHYSRLEDTGPENLSYLLPELALDLGALLGCLCLPGGALCEAGLGPRAVRNHIEPVPHEQHRLPTHVEDQDQLKSRRGTISISPARSTGPSRSRGCSGSRGSSESSWFSGSSGFSGSGGSSGSQRSSFQWHNLTQHENFGIR